MLLFLELDDEFDHRQVAVHGKHGAGWASRGWVSPKPVEPFLTATQHFGEQLRKLRRQYGWASQEEFAHHIGLDRTYISGLERGNRNPTLDVIVKLTHGLEVKPADLLSNIK